MTAIPQDEFLGAGEILAMFPKLRRNTLKSWGRSGEVSTRPHPTHKRYQLYSVVGLGRMMEKRSDDLLDDFTDARGHWIWVNKVTSKPYNMSLTSINDWHNKGCAALGGKKLDLNERHQYGQPSPRKYVRIEDLNKIIRFRADGVPEHEDWIGFDQAVLLGFDKGFLTKFSNSKDSRRKSPGKGHPALDGKCIQTKPIPVTTNGITTRGIRFWKPDLMAILKCTVPKGWLSRRQARKAFQFTDADISTGCEKRILKPELFPTKPTHGRPANTLHFREDQLRKLQQFKTSLKEMPRPGAQSRSFHDTAGSWLPQREAAARTGARSIRLSEWRITCPHLDGKPLRAKQVKIPLFRSKHGLLSWVYLEDDLDRVHRRINGLPEPARAVVKRKKNTRGQPLTPEEDARRAGIVDEWVTRAKNSYRDNGGLAKYCQDREISVKNFEAMQALLRMRNYRNRQA